MARKPFSPLDSDNDALSRRPQPKAPGLYTQLAGANPNFASRVPPRPTLGVVPQSSPAPNTPAPAAPQFMGPMRDAFASRQMLNRIPMTSPNPDAPAGAPQPLAINPAAAPGSPDPAALQAQIKVLQAQLTALARGRSPVGMSGPNGRVTTEDVHAANRAATGNKLGMGIGGSLLPIPRAPFKSMQLPEGSKADRAARRQKERAQFTRKGSA